MKQRAINGGNDEYFTKVEVARKCISELISLIGNDFLFIEPSAGGGSFITEMTPSIIGYDINPKYEGVIKGNWFDVNVPSGCVVLGNPPFGFAASMAIKFFNHAATGASYIGFIVPRTFRKASVHSKLDLNFWLIHDVDIERNSFLVDGIEYDVPCCFQIWERRVECRVIGVEVEAVVEFVKPAEAEFCIRRVGGRAGQLLDGLDHSVSSTYFCRAKFWWVKDAVNDLDLGFVNNTAGVRSISKYELQSKLIEIGVKKYGHVPKCMVSTGSQG